MGPSDVMFRNARVSLVDVNAPPSALGNNSQDEIVPTKHMSLLLEEIREP